jgi:peptidoglycan glycosyltransferase
VYSHIVGYWSTRYGASGIEISENAALSSESGEPQTLDELVNQMSGGPQAGNDVELTLDPKLQHLTYDQLAASTTGRGAAVALNPKTGEILAMASYPSYDPNNLDKTFPDLSKDPNSGLLNRATQGLYPPGSTFKVITTAAAIEAGVKPTDKFNDTGAYETPGYTVYNFQGKKYGDVTFKQALANSINAIFARIGYEYVGPQKLAQTAQDFGFGVPYKDFPLPVSTSEVSELPPEQWAQGGTAQISFGQGPVVSNVFEMGLVAATIANEGTMMEPRIVREIRSPDGAVIDKPSSRVRKRVLDKETAKTVNDMMQSVITDVETTGQIPGIKVAAKTGTAEASGNEIHSWFIAFAPADDPKIAVAVLVENGQEGYKAALPIARRMMETYLGPQETSRSTQQAAAPQSRPEATNPNSQPAQPKNVSPFQFPFQFPFQNPAQSPIQVPGKGQDQNPGQRPGG